MPPSKIHFFDNGKLSLPFINKTSYTFDEIVWGAKFVSSYYTGENGMAIFEINKLGNHVPIELNKVEDIVETSSN